MRYFNYLAVIIFAAALASCATGALTNVDSSAEVTALNGSSLDGVSVNSAGEVASVHFLRIPQGGQFVRLNLAPGQHAGGSNWDGGDEAVKLVVPTDSGADIGIVPLPGTDLGPVTLHVELASAPRVASVPPVGDYNVITDLTITDAGGGGVTLEWTQVNTGDYDFNSEVNLADLVPIAQHFNETYDRQAAGASETTAYWVDGDGNGEINAADVTPIGLNYNALVVGYNIHRENQLIPGPNPGGPTVPLAEGTTRAGLPPRYSKTVTGLITDTYVVAPVDADGIEGADSSGNAGPVELRANVNIDGQLLLDILNGQNPGAFGPGKMVLRVIDPIEINNSVELGEISMTSTTTADIRNLPHNKVLYLQMLYIPAVDLATGDPKVVASARTPSALEDEIVVTSIPVRIPDVAEPVEVTASVDLSTPTSGGGGFYTLLHTDIVTPGDPVTQSEDKRLDNVSGLIAVDTNKDGIFENEAMLEDDNYDCASESLRENELDDDEYEYEDRNELEVEGIVSGYSEAEGTINLTGATLEAGDLEIELPGTLTVMFSELTNFEQRTKTEGDDTTEPMDPSTITNGDNLHIDLYRLSDNLGSLPDVYWARKVQRRIDQTN